MQHEHEPLKYKTLAELKAAYDSGELSRNDPLWLDNDTASVYIDNPDDEDDSVEVFEMHPELILDAALDLLGIPRDHV